MQFAFSPLSPPCQVVISILETTTSFLFKDILQMLANSRNSNPKKLRHGFLGTPMNRFLISTFGLTERGCIKIEISFHFVILNGDLEYTS